MQPKLKYKCPEKLQPMKVGMISRFCDTCQKDVHDLRHMNREELITFLLNKRGESICGRVHASQLDYSHNQVEATITGIIKQKRYSNLAFYLLAVGAISLVGCTTDSNHTNANQTKFMVETHRPDTVTSLDTNNQLEQLKDTVKLAQDTLVPPPVPLVGMVVVNDSIEITQEGLLDITDGEIVLIDELDSLDQGIQCIYEVVEIMPEFPGGIDSLFQFIQTHLKYPEYELNNGIEGKVYVEFIVNEDGQLSDAKILRSVPGSIHFDAEVLRIVNLMPNWIPGRENGQPVKVKYRLPIRFRNPD